MWRAHQRGGGPSPAGQGQVEGQGSGGASHTPFSLTTSVSWPRPPHPCCEGSRDAQHSPAVLSGTLGQLLPRVQGPAPVQAEQGLPGPSRHIPRTSQAQGASTAFLRRAEEPSVPLGGAAWLLRRLRAGSHLWKKLLYEGLQGGLSGCFLGSPFM